MSIFGGGGGESSSSSITYNKPQPITGLEVQGGDIWSELQKYLVGATGQDLQTVDHADEIAQLKAQINKLRPPGSPPPKGDAQNQLQNLRKKLTELENDRRIVDKPLSEGEQLNKQLQDQLYGKSLSTLDQGIGGGISPEVRAELDKIYGAEEEKIFQDLQRRGIEASGQQGMNFSDSPIFNPFMREMANSRTQLGGMKARDILSQNAAQLQRAQGLREFQESLNAQKFTQQFNTASQGANMANLRYGQRLSNPRRTSTFQTTKQSGGGGGLSGLLGTVAQNVLPSAIGAFTGGAGAAALAPHLMGDAPGGLNWMIQ